MIFIFQKRYCTDMKSHKEKKICNLKSLGPIDRKFHGHGENDGFVQSN